MQRELEAQNLQKCCQCEQEHIAHNRVRRGDPEDAESGAIARKIVTSRPLAYSVQNNFGPYKLS